MLQLERLWKGCHWGQSFLWKQTWILLSLQRLKKWRTKPAVKCYNFTSLQITNSASPSTYMWLNSSAGSGSARLFWKCIPLIAHLGVFYFVPQTNQIASMYLNHPTIIIICGSVHWRIAQRVIKTLKPYILWLHIAVYSIQIKIKNVIKFCHNSYYQMIFKKWLWIVMRAGRTSSSSLAMDLKKPLTEDCYMTNTRLTC